jgi:hypothetical protein
MEKKIVFVHGFVGGKSTWGKFPDLIREELSLECNVAEYGFSTLYWPVFGKSTTVHNLAEGLLTEIKTRLSLDDDEIVLVGHSLGGLIIRQMLLNLELKNIPHKIRKIAFYAVPHDGSGFANISKYLPIGCHKLKALCKDGDFVESLNDQWSYAKLDEKFEILSVIGGKDAVVNANSSKSIMRNNLVETNIEANHKNIVKPIDSNDLSFLLLKKFIESKRKLKQYSNDCSESYRGWQKHDNDRTHGYAFVVDDARNNAYQSLCSALDQVGSIVRVTGLSGLGKSRLVIEYLENNEKIQEDEILVFNGNSKEDDIKSTIKRAIQENAVGVAIIECCSLNLHDYLARELAQKDSLLRVITINFYEEKVDTSPYIHLIELNDQSVTELITPMLPQFDEHQIQKIVGFVEGFPLLGILIAERFKNEGVLSPELTERDFAQKLIDADNNLIDEHRRILQVCSLFDVFGVEAGGIDEADFIIKIAKSDRGAFGQVINQFQQKRIINRVGRFARVVPKPLAVHLASIWWDNNIHDELENLINTLPESLIGSFCTQIKYLDTSVKVKEFVEKICEACSPFGQAELLLSTKGSRLFRALVEVNPNATSNLIYRIFSDLSDQDILNIKSDVRRNFVWALEMLVFHESCFNKSAWCLFKLAQLENENFGNNATGQFTQLFRWQLSGTEADFDQRLLLLNKILEQQDESADLIIIEAIKSAISTYGGTRMIGAEHQGTKPELKEWHPKQWIEIFDYWQALLNLLEKLASKSNLVEAVKEALGHEIRSFITYEKIEMLDKTIQAIIKASDKYWPAASQSIEHALHYDAEGMNEKQKFALIQWQNLLSPDPESLDEKLKLIVLNPSREHVKGADGHYIDIAAEEAKELAEQLKDKIAELIPYLELLMTFPEQKQSWIFGKELILQIGDFESFIDSVLGYVRENEITNSQFISGLFVGLYTKKPDYWKESIHLIAEDKQLQKYYPDLVRTGLFDANDLNAFIELVKNGILPSSSASVLVYGSVTEHLSEDEISTFCDSLSNIDETARWVALDCLNMYMFGNKDYDLNKIKPTLIKLVLAVSFKKEDKSRHSDTYHWLKSVKKLLETEDSNFAIKLCEHLLDQVVNNNVGYSDLWDYLNKAFYKAFELHSSQIWPVLASKFLDKKAIKRYRLTDLLGSGKGVRKKASSIFNLLNTSIVIDWCKSEEALLLVVRSLSIFKKDEDIKTVTPLVIQLLIHYGQNKKLLDEISASFHSRSWGGSLIPYLESDKAAIELLKEHSDVNVLNWANSMCEMIDGQIKRESEKEAEENMLLREGF